MFVKCILKTDKKTKQNKTKQGYISRNLRYKIFDPFAREVRSFSGFDNVPIQLY